MTPSSSKSKDRYKREADALRENLRRRKEQARARQKDTPTSPPPAQ